MGRCRPKAQTQEVHDRRAEVGGEEEGCLTEGKQEESAQETKGWTDLLANEVHHHPNIRRLWRGRGPSVFNLVVSQSFSKRCQNIWCQPKGSRCKEGETVWTGRITRWDSTWRWYPCTGHWYNASKIVNKDDLHFIFVPWYRDCTAVITRSIFSQTAGVEGNLLWLGSYRWVRVEEWHRHGDAEICFGTTVQHRELAYHRTYQSLRIFEGIFGLSHLCRRMADLVCGREQSRITPNHTVWYRCGLKWRDVCCGDVDK